MREKKIKPMHLRAGSRVALVAPAFSFDQNAFEAGRKTLEARYKVETLFLPDAMSQHAYLAGSDERRLRELLHWMLDPSVDAILAIRGGYGCMKIYPDLIKKLRASGKKPRPKIIGGFSDLTVLLNGFHQDLGWITFHSPHVVSRLFREPIKLEEETFFRAFFSAEPLGPIRSAEMTTLVAGRAKAPLVGGCLSLLAASLGTPYEVDTDGKILFLEDVTERSYRVDRMLTQLLHAGKFSKVRGVVFGQMTDILPPKDLPEADALAAIGLSVLPFLKKKKIPCIYNFPAGHGAPQATFPIGVRTEITAPPAGQPCVEFLESATSPPKNHAF